MNKKELESFTNLLKISISIQALYIKLYNMEINNEKETENYSKILGVLMDAIEIEEHEYLKNRKDTQTINNLIHFINNSLKITQDAKSLYAKELPLFRIYHKLQDLTYDIDYQISSYNKEPIDEIGKYLDFENLFSDEIEKKYEPFIMEKELITGMINKFSKLTNKKHFKTNDIIEQKYFHSYIYSYIEIVYLANDFDDYYEYPRFLLEADYLRINKESYNNNKTQILLQESGRIMNNLLYKKQDKIPFLLDKAYFQFITDSLSLENLASLDKLFNIQKETPLNGYKLNQIKLKMVKGVIDKAINKKLEEFYRLRVLSIFKDN